jgi:hypothetical protein
MGRRWSEKEYTPELVEGKIPGSEVAGSTGMTGETELEVVSPDTLLANM